MITNPTKKDSVKVDMAAQSEKHVQVSQNCGCSAFYCLTGNQNISLFSLIINKK